MFFVIERLSGQLGTNGFTRNPCLLPMEYCPKSCLAVIVQSIWLDHLSHLQIDAHFNCCKSAESALFAMVAMVTARWMGAISGRENMVFIGLSIASGSPWTLLQAFSLFSRVFGKYSMLYSDHEVTPLQSPFPHLISMKSWSSQNASHSSTQLISGFIPHVCHLELSKHDIILSSLINEPFHLYCSVNFQHWW